MPAGSPFHSRSALIVLALSPFGLAVLSGADPSATPTAALFDDEVLADNVLRVTERFATRPGSQRFDDLARWVLPSGTRSTFRMNAAFAQTDPPPNLHGESSRHAVDGIVSPVFELIRVAEETGLLSQLRDSVSHITDPVQPHERRAKLALLFMIHIAMEDSDAATTAANDLAELVRTRGDNRNGRWWPETLALAWGIRFAGDMVDLTDLTSSIYDLQIAQSQWSGSTAWDSFVLSCFAQIRQRREIPERPADSQTNFFQNWIPADVVTAESRGTGCPRAVWRPEGTAVHKLCGHNNDYLYLPIPLTGNFELQCDVTSFNYRETQMSYAGLFASHNWRLSEAEVGGIRRMQMVPLDPPMTYPDDWLSCRIVVRDGRCTHYINGREFWRRTLAADRFPWVALRGYRLTHGSIRNFTVSGSPVIPESVNMIVGDDLTGWFSYFDAPVDEHGDDRSWISVPGIDGKPEVVHKKRPHLSGTDAESLLLYHRPMIEDSVIEYEFFYAPGKTLAHPALDRLAFLLTPDGVQTHWVTDGIFQRELLSPDNRTDELHNSRGPAMMPLKSDAWNGVRISVSGDVLRLTLNGTDVFERQIEASNGRQFGLFHYADRTDVRVRNIRWTGDWIRSVKSPSFPKSVRSEVTEIERATAALPQSFQHDFRNSQLPETGFTKRGQTIIAAKEGLVTKVASNGGWAQADVPVRLKVGGDFDLRATYVSFRHSETGTSGIQLMATLEGTAQEIRLARTRVPTGRQEFKMENVLIDRDGNRQSASRVSVCEATSGTLRLVRLGKTLYYLAADDDSRVFRLLGTDDAGTEDLRVGDTSVSMLADLNGSAEVLWTDLSIRAERLSGMALLDVEAEVDQLNQQRDKLPVFFVQDFERTAPNFGILYRSNEVMPWNETDGGLKIAAPGADTWRSSGIGIRQPIPGDFDIAVEFDSPNLATPAADMQTALLLQVRLTGATQSQLTSQLCVESAGVLEAESYTRVLKADGSHQYGGGERLVVPSASALRIIRHGRRFTMLVRPNDSKRYRIIAMAENGDSAVALAQVMLHTGGAGRQSSVLLKKLIVHADGNDPGRKRPVSAGEQN